MHAHFGGWVIFLQIKGKTQGKEGVKVAACASILISVLSTVRKPFSFVIDNREIKELKSATFALLGINQNCCNETRGECVVILRQILGNIWV